MIWVNGRIVSDDELKVSVLDRTFEHGLGLFETLRTWNGRAVLLDRHLARLTRSARELGVPLDTASQPDADAVHALLESGEIEGDALLRITLSGGVSDSGTSTLWMRSAPLPAPMARDGATVAFGYYEASPSDPLARHKTLNYWLRRTVFEQGRKAGFDEVLSATPDKCHWEGSRTNLFIVRDNTLFTPSLDGPIVPGVMRDVVLDHAEDLQLWADDESYITDFTIETAQEIFLTNSVRGIIPVNRAFGRDGSLGWLRWSGPAPGPWTQRLWIEVSEWLQQGGPDE